MTRRLAIAVAALLVSSPMAHAHRLAVQWQAAGQTLHLQATLDNAGAAGAAVELRSSADTLLATARLDPEGRAQLPLTNLDGDVVVVVQAGPGHRRTLRLSAADLRAGSAPRQSTSIPEPVADTPPVLAGSSDGTSGTVLRALVGLSFLLGLTGTWMAWRTQQRLNALEADRRRHES